MGSEARSPLKAKPLRNPGQSLDEQIQSILDDKLLSYLYVAGAFVVMAMMEWVGHLLNWSRQPWLYTIVAVLLVLWSAWKFFPLRRQVRALGLGRDGERAVGQFLDGLRESGARIFHDIPGDNFNLDHVVISERGVFVVETKTLSKPYPDARVRVDQDEVFAAGQKMDRNPLRQVRAQGDWLSKMLQESTGRAYIIQPVIVFPGWFVEPLSKDLPRDVWVLEPKALPGFIEKEELRLRPEDVALAAFHLSRFIRAKLAE